MNTQKQVIIIVALFFLTVGACAGYTIIELPYRTELQADWHFEESVERGALLYANNCRTCHGNAGEGFVGPQLNKDEFQNQDPLVLAANRDLITRTLVCGRIGTRMPAWLSANGGALNAQQIEHLVNLLTSPDAEGVLDENGVPTSVGWHEAVEFAHNLNHEVTVLVAGDTLQSIAASHGIGVGELAELNGIGDVDAFLEEQSTIELPAVSGAPDGGSYKVTGERDTIRGIAERAFVGAALLADQNGLDYELDYDELTFQLRDGGDAPGLITGQLLSLPDGATYTVVSGESIEVIAQRHGLAPEDIVAVNPPLAGTDVTADLAPADDDGVIPTVVIDLPAVDAYVTRGQSWDEVAEGYGNVTGASLAEANDSATNISLRVSEGLVLPADAYGTAPPATLNSGAACVQYAVPNSIYDQLKDGGGLAPPEPFEGTVVATDATRFHQNSITLPPGAGVVVTFDNQDPDNQHNIQFFASEIPGQGDKLPGCTSGCPADAVETELAQGPVEQTFTFTTPDVGTYSFNCIAHPDQMTGTLTIEEGAEIPEASQP